MKKFFQLLILILVTTAVAQNEDYAGWITLANEDPGLQPEYGNIQKTEKQKESDEIFVKELLAEYNGDKKLASEKMVELGFQYLYEKRDLETAMRRFNQAFLVNPKNADLYYGFGTVYFNLGAMDEARKQYDKGLKIDPKHFEILTDYGTTYLGEYYNDPNPGNEQSQSRLDLGLKKLKESFQVNPNYASTTYKLSILYLLQNDCVNSEKFLDLTKVNNSGLISKSYLNEFNFKCRENDLDCSEIRTGKFRIQDENSGITIITRTDKFQIEENEKLGYKWKLSVTWINDCTYQLKPVEDLLDPGAELPTMIVTCEIREVTPNYYQQLSSSDFDSFTMSTKVEILE